MLSRRVVLAGAAAFAALAAAPVRAQEGGDASPADLAVAGPLPEMSMGDENAPVTVIEYASMTCGHCANFHVNSLTAIKEKYIDTGKVRYILREFPLDPRAMAGFMLARCAGDDKYFAMVDALFRQQPAWAFVDGSQVLTAMGQIAKQAGFTQQQFEACLKDQKLYDGINVVKQRASDVFGVSSTPTFFINGKRHAGALTPDEFAAIVDPML